jgi:hypothetical protein
MKYRQVKLPRVTKEHPLVVGLKKVMEEEGVSMHTLATRDFKLSQQTLYIWYRSAKKNRDFNLPPRQVPVICHLTGQAPWLYNPELWPNREWRL